MNAPDAAPQRLAPSQHGIPRDHVDANAVDVVSNLQQSGYSAFLVGGCVRDLLLGHTPKDFDVATNATPEQVRAIFRRCRLVGRRFRIAHVRFGREVIEVSTYRSAAAEQADERSHSAEGMILRDNVYGTVEEDAFRRDFTVNALYYDPATEEVIDYVGGLEDISRKRLHFIGDTRVRLREDPVRALRALRFQAKLEFTLDPAIERELDDVATSLTAIPPARLFDEMLKLFLSGYGAAAWRLIAESPLRAVLFPVSGPDDALIDCAMQNTDARIEAGKPVTPGFLIAAMLWADVQARTRALEEAHKPAEARYLAAAEALAAQQALVAIPRRFSQFARDVWGLQHRLESRRVRGIQRLLTHARFRAGYDLLVLRARAGEPLQEEADWWTTLQSVDKDTQQQMIDDLPKEPTKRRKRKRRRKKSAAGSSSVECP